jgi:hypothetical protein
MAAKSGKGKELRGARWSLSQLNLFASVLADDQNDFAFTLESLALKKSANIHVFESIKKEFDSRLHSQAETEQPDSSKKQEKSIDTSVLKLRAKYKWMKDKWRHYTDRAKSGSGKAAINEPEWFHIIDPIFSETNTKLKVTTKANDLMSSENEEDSNDESSYDPNGEGINNDDFARSQQQSPLSIQSNTSLDGTTSSHSSDEEDQTDQR